MLKIGTKVPQLIINYGSIKTMQLDRSKKSANTVFMINLRFGLKDRLSAKVIKSAILNRAAFSMFCTRQVEIKKLKGILEQ